MTGVTITPEMRAQAMSEALREIGRSSRLPFRKLLAELIGAKPEAEALRTFAARYPDKWAQALSILAGLAGYEKGLIELNVYNVGQMSDVQLLAELRRGQSKLREMRLIEAAPAEVLPPTIVDNPPGAVDKESTSPPVCKSEDMSTPSGPIVAIVNSEESQEPRPSADPEVPSGS